MVFTHLACTSFGGDDPAADAAPAEAQADAASEADAAHFCAAHADAALCADFDEGDPVSFHFTQLVGNVTLDDAGAASPPLSMRVVSTDGSASLLFAHATPARFLTQQRLSFATSPGMLQPAPASFIAGIQQGTDCSFDIESFGARAQLVLTTPGDAGRVYKASP